MTEEQISALKALANSKYWEVVSKDIFSPYIKDVTEPYDDRINKLCEADPGAAYIGRLMANAILNKMVNTVNQFKEGRGVKQDTKYD